MRVVVRGASGLVGILLVAACATSGVGGDDGTTTSSSSGATSGSTTSGSTTSGSTTSGSTTSGSTTSGSTTSGSTTSGSTTSGSTTSSSGGTDAGRDTGPDTGVDAGIPTAPVLTVVKPNGQLLGVTTDAAPHIVYFTAAATIEAVPVAGGAPVVIATGIAATDQALVSGGVVAWFTGFNAVTGLFAVTHVWTKTYGTKDLTSASHGIFAGSKDGTRIALEVNAVDDLSTQLAVTDAAAPVLTAPALSGANAVNLAAFAADNCVPQLGFAVNTFVGAFCTGTAATATRARMVTVGAADTTATLRFDNNVTGISPYWVADDTGTKFGIAEIIGTALSPRVVMVAGATTTIGTIADVGIATLDIVGDGSALVYRTSTNVLKKATVAATPVVTQMATGVLGMHTSTTDRKRFAYYTQDSGAGDFNVFTVDATAATPTPATIVAAATAYSVNFTGNDANIVYLDQYNGLDGTGKLKRQLAAGGSEIMLDPVSLGVFPSLLGTGVLSISNVAAVGGSTTQFNLTLKYTDSVVGGALKPGASNVFFETAQGANPGLYWSAKTLAFSDISATPSVSKLVVP